MSGNMRSSVDLKGLLRQVDAVGALMVIGLGFDLNLTGAVEPRRALEKTNPQETVFSQ